MPLKQIRIPGQRLPDGSLGRPRNVRLTSRKQEEGSEKQGRHSPGHNPTQNPEADRIGQRSQNEITR